MALENDTKAVEKSTPKLENAVSEKLHNEVFDRYPQNYQTKDVGTKDQSASEKPAEQPNKSVSDLPKLQIVGADRANAGGGYASAGGAYPGDSGRSGSNRGGAGPSAAGFPALESVDKPLLKRAQ